MTKCSPDTCRVVDRVRVRMAIEGVADDLEKCRARRCLSAFKAWFDESTVKSYKEVE